MVISNKQLMVHFLCQRQVFSLFCLKRYVGIVYLFIVSFSLPLTAQIIPNYQFENIVESSYQVSSLAFSLIYPQAGYYTLLGNSSVGFFLDGGNFLENPAVGVVSDSSFITADYMSSIRMTEMENLSQSYNVFLTSDLGRWSIGMGYSFFVIPYERAHIASRSLRLNAGYLLWENDGFLDYDLSVGVNLTQSESYDMSTAISTNNPDNIIYTSDFGLLYRVHIPSLPLPTKYQRNLLIGLNYFNLPLVHNPEKYIPQYSSFNLSYFLSPQINIAADYFYAFSSSDPLDVTENYISLGAFWQPIPLIGIGASWREYETQTIFNSALRVETWGLSVTLGFEKISVDVVEGFDDSNLYLNVSFDLQAYSRQQKAKVERKKKARVLYQEALELLLKEDVKSSIELLEESATLDPALNVVRELLKVLKSEDDLTDILNKNLDFE